MPGWAGSPGPPEAGRGARNGLVPVAVLEEEWHCFHRRIAADCEPSGERLLESRPSALSHELETTVVAFLSRVFISI